jgi:hypothetical protein
MADQSYIGKGRIYMGPYDQSTGPNLAIGNCSKLELAIEQETKDLLDYTQAGGGKANSLSRITAVKANITMHDVNGENLAKALYGSNTATTSLTAITDESHASVQLSTAKEGFITTNRLINTGSAVVVKVSPSTTKTAGTDYVVRPTGIEILAGSTIADGDTLLVSYTPVAEDQVEALVNSGVEWKLYFDGLNEARSSKPVSVTLHRVKFAPVAALGLISDEFAGLEVSAEVLSDSLQTTGSKYFDVRIAQ